MLGGFRCLPYFLRQGVSLTSELTNSATLTSKFQGPDCLSPHPSAEVTNVWDHTCVYTAAGDPNLGPHACMASISPTESPPQFLFLFSRQGLPV